MNNFNNRILLNLLVFLFPAAAFTQIETRADILKQASVIQAQKEKISYEQLKVLAREKGWKLIMKDKKGNTALLVDVDDFGLPIYTSTETNLLAAATIGTSSLWPGGSTGLNLSGSSNNMKNKLALWDGGKVRITHQELTGRVVQRDGAGTADDHTTHVAGILIASGVVPEAKGMSFGQQELVAYDFSNDGSEMMSEAPNLLVSNHSYSAIAGWRYNGDQSRWEFWGQAGANEDYKFGYYSNIAQLWDSIAYNAPYYLIVKAAGNKRDENGPAVGSPYWRFDASGNMVNAGNRPAGISNNDSYDNISTYGTSKNILTVGAVFPIPYGYKKPWDVSMTSFSSWGPTDDGRIKPDVVADGVNLLSSVGTADNAYDYFSGTSMATPSAAGSLLLLQEYYSKLHSGAFMRAATLKGLTIHTADESGPAPGPDYQHGWGLINVKKAAEVIKANNTTHLIQETVLTNNGTFSIPVIASGNGTLSATISWTDPKGDVTSVALALNNTTPKLVNDLDLVIKKGATVYSPWKLNPGNRAAPATTGDNVLDNVEKVELPNVIPGDTYTIEVKHKGILARSSQAFSLIASGVGGQAYCTSAATDNTGARIDSVSFANIQNKNAAGCTSYNSFTNLIGNIQPLQTIPVFIRLNSCDGSSADKIVKIFIDANNDGDFADADETLATSTVINGNGDFTTNITMPAGLTEGKYSILRVVMQETNSSAAVTSCGSYLKGETQDYRVFISAPSTDVGILQITAPEAGQCKSAEQYATVRIRNFGSAAVSNVPVTFTIKQGSTTIATINGVFTGTIGPGADTSDVDYTLQTPFSLVAGSTYSLSATTTLSGDLNQENDSVSATITTSPDAAAPTGTANICNTTAQLRATSTSNAHFNWYNAAAATTPLASGNSATTSTILSTYYLGTGEVSSKLGPANKMAFPTGSYNQFSPGVRLTATVPTYIKSARLYIGHPGNIIFHVRKLVNFNSNDGSYSYYPVHTVVLNVTPTAPTPPVLGNQINDPADLGAIYNLGFYLPEAGDYIIAIEFENGASIYRNNQITTTNYPYTIPELITITGNSAIQAGNPNYYQSFYYYFYNIDVEPALSCPSPRVPIVATTSTAPTVTVNGNLLTSSAANSYRWYLNGALINGANGQTYSAIQSGLYKVETTDSRGCTLMSAEVNVTVTAVVNVDPSFIGLKVSPNPVSSGEFYLQMELRKKDDLDISLLNSLGQKVYNYNIPGFTGRFAQTVKPGILAPGIYYLRIQHDNKMYVKKIVITK